MHNQLPCKAVETTYEILGWATTGIWKKTPCLLMMPPKVHIPFSPKINCSLKRREMRPCSQQLFPLPQADS